jgi:hypothetical protein
MIFPRSGLVTSQGGGCQASRGMSNNKFKYHVRKKENEGKIFHISEG